MNLDDPVIDPADLRAANSRCDADLRQLGFDPQDHIRPGWNPNLILRNGKLTDKKIAKYQKAGFYSEEYRAFRKANMNKKKPRRIGNYLESEGRLIFCP